MKKITIIILILLGAISCDKEKMNKDVQQDTNNDLKIDNKEKSAVFEKIGSLHSGIDFSNNLEDKLDTYENLFDFDFFYNGSGVGIADINNDGLDDIFFCGNQVQNRLYVNKGNLQFEDITEKANVNTNKQWANGVTFADVNNDGWLDIYVSQGGPFKKENRKNLLFINQKDQTFVEKGEEYGLNDGGISTQSSFFDYDKDGDLDCIVSNENELFGLDPVKFHNALKNNKELLYDSSAHLYQNNQGKFKDVTEAAGVLKPTFGLGLTVADINNDGWLDFYIANDYYLPDVMYINNKNGTFSDKIKEKTKQITFYGMGVDIEDINNDGFQDIYVLDMASSDHIRSKTLMASMNVSKFNLLTEKFDFQIQYMYNSLQLNAGNNKFHNISQIARVSKTDWSWAGLMIDFNNDEYKDIYVTNGYRRYALDNDFQNKVKEAKIKYRGKVPLQVKKDLYFQMPSEKLSNIMFRNNTKLGFDDVSPEWGLKYPSFSNGASYADLDNDGDLEIVVNNIDDEAFLYKNLSVENNIGNFLRVKTTGKTSENFAKVTIKYDGKLQFIESKRVKGYLSATDNTAHFGLKNYKNIDTVKVEWLSGKYEERYNVSVNELIEFREEDAILKRTIDKKSHLITETRKPLVNFEHKENNFNDFEKEVLIPYKQSTLGPSITAGDINGDGLEDIYVGGASGQAGQIFIQSSNGFKKVNNLVFLQDKIHEDMESVFFDLDNDGDLDLYVVSGGNQFEFPSDNYRDRIYINNGMGTFKRHKSSLLDEANYSGKTVCAIDFDKDGDMDLLVGNRIFAQNYPKSPPSFLYENTNGKLRDVTEEVAPDFSTYGIVNKVIKTDFNNDGFDDFIAVGEWTGIGFFENQKGIFKNISEKSALDDEKGWWFTVAEIDVNNDGLQDYIVGNVGKNIKFKASKENEFKVFANDFDNNGTLDVVLSKKYNGVYVPARGKECSTQQMPFVSEKFKTYNEFAHASLVDVYGDKLETSVELSVNEFKSIVLINKGEGEFEKHKLPIFAQFFPILDVEILDVNNDGFEDAIVLGNIYNTEVETPRLDNGTGLVLLSNQKDGFNVMHLNQSGLYVPGNVKSVQSIDLKNKRYLLFGRNNDTVLSYLVN
jgi:hypothetical protein